MSNDEKSRDANRILWDRTMFIEHVNESTCGRPSVFIPFGGLGSGRMPFGHSGDIVTSWETLQFLPYYSATASNVLYSYIAHDVGGHRDYGHGSDPELYAIDAILALVLSSALTHRRRLGWLHQGMGQPTHASIVGLGNFHSNISSRCVRPCSCDRGCYPTPTLQRYERGSHPIGHS